MSDTSAAHEDQLPSRAWRDLLPVHPAAEMFPMMSEAELRALGKDIQKRGQQAPIVIIDGLLLDGRNRLDAMELVGIDCAEQIALILGDPRLADDDAAADDGVVWLLAKWLREDRGNDPYALAISLNIQRRHLTAEQKRDLIAKLLKGTPEKSNRQIAETVKASHVTVGAVRSEMEATGQIDQLTKTVGKDGKTRKQPKRRDPHDYAAMTAGAQKAEAAAKKRRDADDFKADIAAKQVVVVPGGDLDGDSEEVCWRRGLLYRATNAAGEAKYENWSKFPIDRELVDAADRAAHAWTKTAMYLRRLIAHSSKGSA
jgi:hypothetical protein